MNCLNVSYVNAAVNVGGLSPSISSLFTTITHFVLGATVLFLDGPLSVNCSLGLLYRVSGWVLPVIDSLYRVSGLTPASQLLPGATVQSSGWAPASQ